MIHFKRNDGDIYDIPNSSSGSAGHALIQRILFNRRRQISKGEPFAVLGSRKPHYIHIRTSGAYAHYLGAEYHSPPQYSTKSHVTLTEDSASEYSCDSAEAQDRPSQSIDFTVIWDPETGFSVYGNDSGDHTGGSSRQVKVDNHKSIRSRDDDHQKKPLPRLPSGISVECQGLSSQFPGETDSEKESFFGASNDSGHPDSDLAPTSWCLKTASSQITNTIVQRGASSMFECHLSSAAAAEK
ncbi:hypothetical protein BDQ17DRAFT_1332559 [Cyathus striatus]|nr:hypothetical protein BDQ17DRAFT_1332559 [Cyathus striatus]